MGRVGHLPDLRFDQMYGYGKGRNRNCYQIKRSYVRLTLASHNDVSKRDLPSLRIIDEPHAIPMNTDDHHAHSLS